MKAIVINKTGSSSQMKCEEVPIPEPGQNEVTMKPFGIGCAIDSIKWHFTVIDLVGLLFRLY